jgi:RNA polymerase sigma factor (sigma-70 family)
VVARRLHRPAWLDEANAVGEEVMIPLPDDDAARPPDDPFPARGDSAPREMDAQRLAARCQHTRPDGSHEPFCFELFRRAIAEGCSLSWHYLHHQYYRLVRYWVSQRTSSDSQAVDDLTQDAFAAFWRFYTADKLDAAGGLGSVLSYLKSCASSAVAQAHRKADRRVPQADWDAERVDDQAWAPSTEGRALGALTAERIWEAVVERCKNEQERLVARSTFLAGLKPRHIAERFPDAFPEVSEVYRVKRNLLARLQRDPTLQRMCKNRPDDRLVK